MLKYYILLNCFFSCFLSNSQVVFEKLYQENGAYAGYDIIPTFDNGYMVSGFCNPTNTIFGQDFLFLKIDSLGTTQWATNYGMNSMDISNAVVQVQDSGYVACGFGSTAQNSSDDVYLVKINKNGGFEWEKTYGTLDGDAAFDLVYTPSDSGFAIVGNKGNNPWLLKTDKFGDTLWTKIYSDSAVLKSIISTSDGGFLVTGVTGGYLGERGIVMKLDSQGNSDWTTYFVGGGGERLFDCCETSDGNYSVSGESLEDSPPPFSNGIIRLLDPNGALIWYKTYGNDKADYFVSMCKTNESGFVMVGNTNFPSNSTLQSQVFVVKTDENGDLIWEYNFGDDYPTDDSGYGICKATDGGYVICGTKAPISEIYVYVIKINENGSSVKVEELIKWANLTVFPNPFMDQATISFDKPLENNGIINVISTDGKIVYSDILKIGEKEYILNKNNLSSGYYTLSIQNGKSITTKKIIIN